MQSKGKGYDVSLKAYERILIDGVVKAGDGTTTAPASGDHAFRGGQFLAATPDFLMSNFIYAGKGATAPPGVAGGHGGAAIVVVTRAVTRRTRALPESSEAAAAEAARTLKEGPGMEGTEAMRSSRQPTPT